MDPRDIIFWFCAIGFVLGIAYYMVQVIAIMGQL
jgi:hypothetical protein